MPKITSNPRRVRQRLGMDQSSFWRAVKVTQSGGSRYESGRTMPPAVQALFVIAYGTNEQAAKMLNAVRGTVIGSSAFTKPQPKVRRTAAA